MALYANDRQPLSKEVFAVFRLRTLIFHHSTKLTLEPFSSIMLPLWAVKILQNLTTLICSCDCSWFKTSICKMSVNFDVEITNFLSSIALKVKCSTWWVCFVLKWKQLLFPEKFQKKHKTFAKTKMFNLQPDRIVLTRQTICNQKSKSITIPIQFNQLSLIVMAFAPKCQHIFHRICFWSLCGAYD